MRYTPGQVIHWKPTRHIFAISSGSWTGHAANKNRPCLIVENNATHELCALPLLGAEIDDSGRWGPKHRMRDPEWWHPLDFQVSNIPAPWDSLQRKSLSFPMTSYPPRYGLVTPKPSFLWVGDFGQPLSNGIDAPILPYWSFTHAQMQKILDCIEYWNEVKPPPQH